MWSPVRYDAWEDDDPFYLGQFTGSGCQGCDFVAVETGGVVGLCLTHQNCTHKVHHVPKCCSDCGIHVTPHKGCFLR